MSSFTSILTHIGGFFKKIFDVAIPVAQAAEPVIDLALPGIASLYNSTVAMVANAEMAATAAGAQNGTGPQKLAQVLSALRPIATEYFKSQNITVDDTVLTNWVNAVVASLNAIPAPSTTTAATAPATPAAA